MPTRPEVAERAAGGRTRIVVAVVAVALVAVVATVALLGGFADRLGEDSPVRRGSVVASGPFELTLDKATVQHRTSKDTWEVVASGTIRTTGATSIAPETGKDGFLWAKVRGTDEVQPAEQAKLVESDPDAAYLSRSAVTPGLPPVPWSVTFVFTRRPGPEVLVGVFEQKYTTRYIFGDERSWQTDRDETTTLLPLEPLPDEKY